VQAAVNLLNALLNKVEAQAWKKFSADTADALIASAQAIIDVVGNEP
jgi:hypothetical protein